MAKNQSVSIFFPCYNDSQSIKTLVTAAFKVIRPLTDNYEVLVVNDGSTDNSSEVLKQLAVKYKKLKIVTHKKNRGYGGALKSGFSKSRKDLVFYTDGDGQYDVNELPLLFNLMTPDVNFINGIKMHRHDPTYRIFIGNLYNLIVRWLFWLPVYDVDCDFRLIRRSLLKKIKLNSSSGSICVELVKKAQRQKAVFRQISVHHYERKWGKSQFFRLDKLFSTFKELLSLWLNLVITDKPPAK